MKVAIIDDTAYKIDGLTRFLAECAIGAEISVARSFQSGVRLVHTLNPDLVLLDMSLPTFERNDGGLEGRSRMFGGREILAEIEFEGLRAKAIVVTQFERFGEPPNAIEWRSLLKDLQQRFPTYLLGGVYYSSIDSQWKAELAVLLKKSGFL